MTTLVVSPEYPIAGMKISLSLTGTESGANFVRYWLTDAPLGSDLRKRLDASEKSRVSPHGGDLAVPYQLTPDKGGRYTFLVEEFTRGAAANGGGYKGAAESAPSETKLAETSLTLQVGQLLETTLGFSPDTAKLRLYVWDDYIRATTLAVHDVETPAIVSPSSPKAANVAQSTDVLTAVGALVGNDASTVTGTISNVFASLNADIAGHLANATAHNSADAFNGLGDGFAAATPAAAAAAISSLRRTLEGHMADTDSSGVGEGGYHDNSDAQTRFAAPGAGPSRLSQMVALADIWRVYEAHRVIASPVHNSADAANPANDLPALMDLHRLFIVGLESATVSAPSTDNPGAAYLAQQSGFSIL